MGGKVKRSGLSPAHSIARTWWLRPALAGGLLAALVAGAGTLVMHHADATPYTVCASGCSYTSISAAVAAASSGATVTVGPGTYGPSTGDAQVIITKPITLQGAGPTQTIINDANAVVPNNAIIYGNSPAAGNITIEGFAFKGVGGDGVPYHFHIFLKQVGGTSAISITDNLFYEDNTTDPKLNKDKVTSVYIYESSASTSITNNTFQGVFQGALLELSSGVANISGNTFTKLLPVQNPSGATINGIGIHDSVYKYSGTPVAAAAQTIANNVFTGFGGNPISVNAGHSGGLGPGSFASMSITGNTFDMSVPAVPDNVLDLGTPSGSDAGTLSNLTLSGNTFSIAGSLNALYLHGNVVGATIDHNLIASGSPQGTWGVLLFGTVATTTATFTNNIIRGFTAGVVAGAMDPASATNVSMHQNCITGNTSYGAQNLGTVALTADHNWWGAASGPNPPGSGDAITSDVTYNPFLTAPAAICAGPVASALATNPGALNSMTGFTFTASLSDTTTGNFAIASGQYSVDGGSYSAMNASDSSFDQVTEAVTVNVGALAAGNHTLCVRGTDAAGNQGAATCSTVNVVLAVAGADVAGMPSTGQVPSGQSALNGATGASAANTTSQASSTANQQPVPALAPHVKALPVHPVSKRTSGLPDMPVWIGLLLALMGMAGIALVLYRVRHSAA